MVGLVTAFFWIFSPTKLSCFAWQMRSSSIRIASWSTLDTSRPGCGRTRKTSSLKPNVLVICRCLSSSFWGGKVQLFVFGDDFVLLGLQLRVGNPWRMVICRWSAYPILIQLYVLCDYTCSTAQIGGSTNYPLALHLVKVSKDFKALKFFGLLSSSLKFKEAIHEKARMKRSTRFFSMNSVPPSKHE